MVARQLLGLEVGHGVQLLEPLDEISLAGAQVGQVHRGVAVKAGAGLFGHPLALGEDLVVQHVGVAPLLPEVLRDRKSTRLNSSHSQISYAVFCLKKKKKINNK